MRKPLPLKFEELPFHPFHRGQGVNYNEGFWRDTFKDVLLALGRVFKWLKKNWRKEFFVSLVFLLALLPEPHQVKAVVPPVAPAYIQPVPRLEPVVAVSFPVPEEVSPVVIPEPPVNEIGACGLGQALPCYKMGCSLSDWACQDAFFTNYANSVYGGWAQAYTFWISHNWW
jgi:hypothetical protein